MKYKEPTSAKRRQSEIRKARRVFLLRARKVQNDFVRIVENYLLGSLDKDPNNKLIPSPANYKRLNQLGVISETFINGPMSEFLSFMTERMDRISEINAQYFKNVSPSNLDAGVKQRVNERVGAKFGIRGGTVVRGGLMAGVASTVGQMAYEQVRKTALSAIASGMSFGDFKQSIKRSVVGSKNLGIIESVLYTAAFDAFQQYDRETQRQYANELGLRYAIYSGGIRDTSRDWCISHVGKVYSSQEIEQWRGRSWQGKNSEPYDPFTDCGGYNCTHVWSWISEELAFRLRPDLKQE